jgi:hypothetical protein
MNTAPNEFPWVTAILVVVAVIVVCVGGAVVIWGPSGALTFQEYLNDLEKFGVALGLLGIGRGIRSGAQKLSGRV